MQNDKENFVKLSRIEISQAFYKKFLMPIVSSNYY
jgi:hypothetical protein